MFTWFVILLHDHRESGKGEETLISRFDRKRGRLFGNGAEMEPDNPNVPWLLVFTEQRDLH
jgi:hypothetical protein